MTYEPLHRRPRWHDRPRAWLRTALDWACGRVEEVEDAPWCASPWCDVAPEPHPRQPDCPSGDHRDYVGFYPDEPLTDDHGNPISDLFTAEVRKCPECGTWYHGTGCHFCGYGYQDDDDIPERPVLRTAKVGGYHLPLSGDAENPRAPFRHDVARPDERPPGSEVAGPGYLQNVPRPGERGAPPQPLCATAPRSGPGHLTMWDIRPVPAPWKPRTWPVIVSGPRVCAGRIALLAGTR